MGNVETANNLRKKSIAATTITTTTAHHNPKMLPQESIINCIHS